MQNSLLPTSITYTEVPIQPNKKKIIDILLTGKETMTKDEIHHKPIYADTTTNFFSNHPTEHKIAAYRYFTTCRHLLPLSPEQKE